MTKRELHKRVVYWRDVMSELGVGHWRVETDICANADDMPGSRTADASVWASGSYDTAKMTFSKDRLEDLSLLELDETIVHEWLHVAHRDLMEAVHSIDTKMALDVQSLWDDRLDHEVEGIIERTARLIVTLHGTAKL